MGVACRVPMFAVPLRKFQEALALVGCAARRAMQKTLFCQKNAVQVRNSVANGGRTAR